MTQIWLEVKVDNKVDIMRVHRGVTMEYFVLQFSWLLRGLDKLDESRKGWYDSTIV